MIHDCCLDISSFLHTLLAQWMLCKKDQPCALPTSIISTGRCMSSVFRFFGMQCLVLFAVHFTARHELCAPRVRAWFIRKTRHNFVSPLDITTLAIYNKSGGDRMLVSLAEYARNHGKDPATARQRAGRGCFKTAVKVGRDWLIEDTEPWNDGRIKSGNYVNSRKSTKKDSESD